MFKTIKISADFDGTKVWIDMFLKLANKLVLSDEDGSVT